MPASFDFWKAPLIKIAKERLPEADWTTIGTYAMSQLKQGIINCIIKGRKALTGGNGGKRGFQYSTGGQGSCKLR